MTTKKILSKSLNRKQSVCDGWEMWKVESVDMLLVQRNPRKRFFAMFGDGAEFALGGVRMLKKRTTLSISQPHTN